MLSGLHYVGRWTSRNRPEGNRTPDPGIQSPVSLASGDSGAAHSAAGRSGMDGVLVATRKCSVHAATCSRQCVSRISLPQATPSAWSNPVTIGMQDPLRVVTSGRPVFPSPGRVIRVGGRVMRAKTSGRRRREPDSSVRRACSSNDCRPWTPHAGRIVACRRREPRLEMWVMSGVVGCGERTCGVTSV
jgi:hypothetical protein